MCNGGQAVQGVFMPLTHYWNGLQQEELHYSITLPSHLGFSVNLLTEPCFPLCGSFALWKRLGDTVFDVAAWPLMEHQASASEPGEVLHQSVDNPQKLCLAEEAKTVKLRLKQISLRMGAATSGWNTYVADSCASMAMTETHEAYLAISQSINQAIIQQLWILSLRAGELHVAPYAWLPLWSVAAFHTLTTALLLPAVKDKKLNWL